MIPSPRRRTFSAIRSTTSLSQFVLTTFLVRASRMSNPATKRRPSSSPGAIDAISKRRRPNDGVDWGEDSEDDDLALKTAEEVDRVGGRGTLLYEILGCVRRLRARYHKMCPYFVSKTLVYEAMVGGAEKTGDTAEARSNTVTATDVDVSLEELKQMNVLMAIYVPSVGDEALIETTEYREIVQRVLQHAPRDGPTDSLRTAGQFFSEKIVGKYHGPTFQLPKKGPSASHLDVLVKHELLLRMPGGMSATGVDVFSFKVPGSGGVLSSMLAGRSELVSRIKRKRHHEMLVSKIRKEVKLRKTVLGIDWHIADLIGSGLVHVIETTVGPILRLIHE